MANPAIVDAIFEKKASTKPQATRQASTGASPQQATVYDGRTYVGSIIRRDRTFEAVDRHGHSLGLFSGQISAMRALAGEPSP
jgi:hypothetical protein